ncbi:MAG: hypothetical protein IPP06_09615 [Saprospiraceae bacterium]|nr:hypothetical protein [Candidatus Vicinibacter affinis]MBK9961559.1 hypothetical protein [Candidatus Vicinibacter affinis]
MAISIGSAVGIFSNLDWSNLGHTILMSVVSAISSYLATKWIRRITEGKK